MECLQFFKNLYSVMMPNTYLNLGLSFLATCFFSSFAKIKMLEKMFDYAKFLIQFGKLKLNSLKKLSKNHVRYQ